MSDGQQTILTVVEKYICGQIKFAFFTIHCILHIWKKVVSCLNSMNMLLSTKVLPATRNGMMGGVSIYKVFRDVLWMRLLRQITMGCCLPLRCKLRSLSPQRREDRDVCGEVFSPFGSRPGLAPGCTAKTSSPLSDPHFSTSSSTTSLMPVCLAGMGRRSPRLRAKGAMEMLPAGPALRG